MTFLNVSTDTPIPRKSKLKNKNGGEGKEEQVSKWPANVWNVPFVEGSSSAVQKPLSVPSR